MKINTVLLLILFLSETIFCQVEVSTRLQAALAGSGENEYIRTLVLLRSQVNIQEIDQNLYSQKASIDKRAYTVITSLQKNAGETQGNLISYLNRKMISSDVFSFQSFWISNMIMVEAKPQVIIDIMSRPDVQEMDIDAFLELDKPYRDEIRTDNPESNELGLRVIKAHLLWAMGITGQGRLVMGVDTGVFPNHPALNHKWRGNFVPSNQAWFDPGGGTTVPNDCDGHGSHTVGIMTGWSPTTGDTVGVAPGAQWIAAKTICTSPHTSNSISAFQWALNPDGNPATTTDMPDAINNSWYDPDVTNECSGIYKTVLDAVEAAGIAVVFSAGNAGPGVSTITKPKNINTHEVNVLCVASIDGVSYSGGNNNPVANSSSRGPSVCGGSGPLLIKPEVSAPGVSVRSSGTSTGYNSLSGTSMAAPHVAGSVALLRQAFPSLTGRQILEALYSTAIDLGSAGEDNTYGKGLIDVYAAFLSLSNPDTIPPMPVTNLTVTDEKSNSLTLQWTVPFDSNGVTGFDIRYSTFPIIDNTTFNNAMVLPYNSIPDTSGGTETYEVQGLSSSTQYHFAVKSKDMWTNWSGLSNPVSGNTLASPQINITPLGINRTFPPSGIYTDTIRIANIKPVPSTLDFNITYENNTFPSDVLIKNLIPGFEKNKEMSIVEKGSTIASNGISFDGAGGPDSYGYKWIDSNEPNGPQYVWNDIITTGTQVTNWVPNSTGSTALDDGFSGPINIGFPFKYYGENKTQLYLCTNGFISFTPVTVSAFSNTVLPATGLPNGIIAAFWDDLDGRTSGTVHYKQESDRFTVQFTNWQIYSATGSLTFQMVLHSNGAIYYYYNNMSAANLNSATIGIENGAGTVGLQIAYNASYVANGKAVKISAAPDWLTGNANNGTIYNGNFVDLILTFNAESLPLGTYSMDVKVASNDPLNALITVPVVMNIQNVVVLNEVKVLIEGLYDGNTMIPDSIIVELHNTGVPYNTIDQIKIPLDTAGRGSGLFTLAVNNSSYFIVIKHRHGLETWSSAGVPVSSGTINYDFTSSASKAFGNNMVQIGDKWCIYSGDLNGDGVIDMNDLTTAGASGIIFQTGYVPEDVNGDMIVDLKDLSIIDNNNNKGIGVIAP